MQASKVANSVPKVPQVSTIPEGYELVALKREGVRDEKSSPADGSEVKTLSGPISVGGGLHQMMAGIRQQGKLVVRLWQRLATQTSGAAAAIAASLRLRYADFNEASSLSNVFNEARAIGGIAMVYNSSAGLTSAVPTHSAVGYTAGTVVPASVVQVLQSSHNTGPMTFNVGGGTPSSVTALGCISFKFVVPKGTIFSNNVTNTDVAGAWFATTNTTITHGYLNLYADAGGAGTTSVVIYVGMDFEFRLRQ
jgi:hypothetical protein